MEYIIITKNDPVYRGSKIRKKQKFNDLAGVVRGDRTPDREKR